MIPIHILYLQHSNQNEKKHYLVIHFIIKHIHLILIQILLFSYFLNIILMVYHPYIQYFMAFSYIFLIQML